MLQFNITERFLVLMRTQTHCLEPLLPFAASRSIAAVPATEAICERLFKAGGQVLISARLRLMGSRVESLLMTNYNAPRFGGIRGVVTMEDSCAGGGGAGGAALRS